MAKELFDWIKLILDKWTVILPICLFLASATGLSFSMVDSADKDAEIKATQEQITNIANHYAAPKTITVKSNCGECMRAVKNLRKEYHND